MKKDIHPTFDLSPLQCLLSNSCERQTLRQIKFALWPYPLTWSLRSTKLPVREKAHFGLQLIEVERRIYASVKSTIIGSDNVLSPGRRQAIIWTNAAILLIGSSGTNFIEILIEIHTFSFKKMHLQMLSRKWRPSCFGPNVSTVQRFSRDIPVGHFSVYH